MGNLYENRLGDYRNLQGAADNIRCPFIIEQVGTDYCKPDYELERKKTPLSVIGYTTNGSGLILENGKEHIAGIGAVFFLRQGNDHFYRPLKKEWTFSWFNVVGDLPALTAGYGLGDSVVFYLPELQEKFISTVNRCVNFNNPILPSQLLGQSFILSLFPYMRYSLLHSQPEGITLESKLKHELEKLCFSEYDIHSVCAALGVSVRHAQRLFKDKYGISPHEYVTKLKINEARSLILNARFSIKEISLHLGMPDTKYFSVFFKKHLGVSPRDFRKIMYK